MSIIGSFEKFARHMAREQFAQDPFALALTAAEIGTQAPGEFDDAVVEQGHAGLQ